MLELFDELRSLRLEFHPLDELPQLGAYVGYGRYEWSVGLSLGPGKEFDDANEAVSGPHREGKGGLHAVGHKGSVPSQIRRLCQIRSPHQFTSIHDGSGQSFPGPHAHTRRDTVQRFEIAFIPTPHVFAVQSPRIAIPPPRGGKFEIHAGSHDGEEAGKEYGGRPGCSGQKSQEFI